MRRELERICVLGGGTAGFLTALTLERFFPEAAVTVIESSSVPILGVGESTTPKLLRLLHHALELDLSEFYRRVQPTWKLGVRYFWGDGEEEFYNNALGPMRPFASIDCDRGLNYNSLNSVLMDHDKSFVVPTGRSANQLKSVALPHSYAYHLDNERLVAFLKAKAKDRGISNIDVKVQGVSKGENGEVLSLQADTGAVLIYDFYVDCSGFRSLLLGDSLGVDFHSYRTSLFTDSAVVGETDHNGIIKPYTEARTMANGWHWNIPMQSQDHVGYVYSSNHCSEDEAEAEFRSLNPGLGEIRRLRFKSGRHDEFVRGNVAAVGNSYGFIEALQSTALHMVVTNIYALVWHLKMLRLGRESPTELNRSLGEIWDRLRWFIALQFKFNRRSCSRFWEDCNAEVDISGAEFMIEQFVEHGPLHILKHDSECLQYAEQGQVFGLFSHDFMLLVLGFSAGQRKPPLAGIERQFLRSQYDLWDQLASRALYQHESLDRVGADSGILDFGSYFEKPFDFDGEARAIRQGTLADFIARI